MNRFITILLLVALHLIIFSALTFGQSTDMETGEIDGVPFRIQIPVGWNGGLVLYTHGYLPRGMSWSPISAALSAVFLERGFAIAESGYSRQGWAVEEAILETEALRQYFSKQHGEPDSAFVIGGSMGGLIALATIEKYPDFYCGALPLCAPLVPALVFFRDRAFDMLMTFESLFGDSLPQEFKPVIEVPGLPAEVVGRVLKSNPSFADRFAQHWDIKPEELPGMIAFYHLAYREITDRAGGNPIDNRNTVYSGFGPISKLNDSIPRYAAVPEALEYLREYYTPTGMIYDPVLELHNTYDPGVPPHMANYYGITASLQGNEKWFAQQWVEADGHCNFEPNMIGQAFDQLRAWAATGVRPRESTLR